MNFSELNLEERLLKAINDLGFVQPTPIQEQTIPFALEGHDVKACAQTGSGKTCAFMLPVMDRLLREPNAEARPSVLVIVPTRELCEQVSKVAHDVAKFTKIGSVAVYGGVSFERQLKIIKSGVDIVIATPGRLLDHVGRRTLNLNHVHTVIMDEADRMLDMGFLPDIYEILKSCPKRKQTMLFSATFPPEIESLVHKFLTNPKEVVLSSSKPAETVTQMVYPVSRSQKEALLMAILDSHHIGSALIFCRTKHGADHLVRALQRANKSVGVIHSDRTQGERAASIEAFRNKQIQLLVATDIASRGLDIKDISHVINFDVPDHPEDYVHRIGRTGRAQATGDAFTIVSPDEEGTLRRIEKFINKPVPKGAIEGFNYLIPPDQILKPKTMADSFGRIRRKIPTGRGARFR